MKQGYFRNADVKEIRRLPGRSAHVVNVPNRRLYTLKRCFIPFSLEIEEGG